MKVILVNPPNHLRDVDSVAPPLGLLVLAEVLIANHVDVEIIDLNLDSCRGTLPTSADFYPCVSQRLLRMEPDLIGFTSMGINSHVGLELARLLKERRPAVTTVFGGPHFSSVAADLKRHFSWVDHVVCGADDTSLLNIVCSKARGRSTNSTHAVAMGAARHPWSAYSTIRLNDYYETNPLRLLNMETGRGCKYRCRFCYSPSHWRHVEELSTEQAVLDFQTAYRMGARRLFLVQDNFLNSPAHAMELCNHLSTLSEKPRWHCYGTLRDIDEEVVNSLSAAGCISIYIGIDAVTDSQKRQFGKSAFSDCGEALSKVKMLTEASVTPTCAFILDAVNWSEADLDSSLSLACKLRLAGADVSLHFLTSYHETALSRRTPGLAPCIADDFRTRLMFDCPAVVVENRFAKAHPSMFPFHARPGGDPCRYWDGVAFVHVAQHLLTEFPLEMADVTASTGRTLVDLVREVYRHMGRNTWRNNDPIAVKIAEAEGFADLLCARYGFEEVATS